MYLLAPSWKKHERCFLTKINDSTQYIQDDCGNQLDYSSSTGSSGQRSHMPTMISFNAAAVQSAP